MKQWVFYGSIFLNIALVIAFIGLINALGGFQYLFYKMNQRGITGIYEHRKNLFEIMPNHSKGEVVFLGNSLTAYCEWSELFDNSGIKNRGIPGDHIFGILERLDEIEAMEPSTIFLMIGVNDLLFHEAKTVMEYYEEMMKQMQQRFPETKLYFQSLLPVNNGVKETTISNNDIIEINKKIEELCVERKMEYIHLFPKFVDKEGNLFANFTADGIHLNGKAYLVWKEALKPYFEE